MAATSFNAFWAGPDKFSFSALYHHSHCIPDHSRVSAALYDYCRDDLQDDLTTPDLDASSSDIDSSPSINAGVSFDFMDSDNSDVIWGDGSDSAGSPSLESEGYESIDYEPETIPYSTLQEQRDDDFGSFKRYTPITMPSFVPQPSQSLSVYNDTHVQPHYLYLPQSQFQSLRSSQPPPLASSSDSSFSSSSAPSPLVGSSGDAIATHATPKQTGSTPRKKTVKKHVRHHSDDDDYRAEDDENADALAKTACKVQNCLVCSRELPESLRVAQPSWAAILRIVFYTLKINYPHKEFFNLRSHVYDFVDAHWERICIAKIKSEHWKKQLQDTLAHNKKLFASGAEVYKQKGFWRLDDLTDPWDDSKGHGGGHTKHHDAGAKAAGSLATHTGVLGVPVNGGGMLGPSTLGGSIDMVADDEDDEYSPPRRHKKPRLHKKAKLEQP